ncbi:PIN-like domain-containing protein [Curtobacterium sp. MCBD17_013]|uniref:PIN-like domain-containing protein n=1 Tax=Curtobacterium sp. MCBD17_013 TaxID=2175668 RepID=UPI0011B68B9E|nr:PIN-like domain-containing protein [Curtobacterium sp. MCBD17_013]
MVRVAGLARRQKLIGSDARLAKLLSVLDRHEVLDSREALRAALDSKNRLEEYQPRGPFILGFDTNAAFRLGLNGTRGANAVDYLRVRHDGPVIIPGQVLQEIWNNSLEGLDPKAKRISAALENLRNEAAGIGQDLGETGEAVERAVAELSGVHGSWIDPSARETFERTLDALIAIGVVANVPRSELLAVARARHETKTPPGFRDPAGNHGDFFVWADFLFGAMEMKAAAVDAVVFVTNDNKKDWSRNGVAHPVLAAEARAVIGKPFYLWSLEEFQRFATEQMG